MTDESTERALAEERVSEKAAEGTSPAQPSDAAASPQSDASSDPASPNGSPEREYAAPEESSPDSEVAGEAADEDDAQPDWEALAAGDPRSRVELFAELHEAEARRDEYLEDVRRARAEFDNYRKRMLREANTQRQAGIAELAGKLLDVLDDFDRTLRAAEDSPDEGLKKGVELVYGNLVEALRSVGLQRIDETGVPFDPNRHEAVQKRDGEEPREEPVVVEVFRPGYEIGGRVLRAAMVVVEQ